MKPEPSQLKSLKAGLYIVATPIGNLGDITLRALETLKAAHTIACEDTRVTAKLLSHYGIRATTISYNDHNADRERPKLLAALREGQSIVLVSDAGTPLISDPGYKLVRDALEEDIFVTTIPGASSVMAALSIAGIPTDCFFFAGFLPVKKEACAKKLASLAKIPSTLVIFESARRLPESLTLFTHYLGNRQAAITRELTKLYEENRRGPLSELAAHYAKAGAPKGEVVIVIAPPEDAQSSEDELKEKLALLLSSHSVKEAATILAEESHRPRKEIYSLALAMIKNHENKA